MRTPMLDDPAAGDPTILVAAPFPMTGRPNISVAMADVFGTQRRRRDIRNDLSGGGRGGLEQ